MELSARYPAAMRVSQRALLLKPLAGMVIAAAAVGLLGGCKSEAKAPFLAQPVQVTTVNFTSQSESWSYVGVVRPRYETDLAFRVGGKLVERLVDVGQSVEAGQTIARLDTTDFQLSVQSQEAELKAAQSSREQAIAAEQRFQILLDKGHVSKAALDQRVATADEARSRVERAAMSLDLARNQLTYADLKADRAGVVSAMPVEVDQVVTAGQLVARVARLDTLEALVSIPEQKLESVRSAHAEVVLWGTTDAPYEARLRELSPEADRISRTYQARFSIETDGARLDLGRTVTVNLRQSAAGQVAYLPLSAVLSDGRDPVVWVVNAAGSRVLRTPVHILALTQEHAVIKAGVKAGDRVVTLGVHMLDEDKPIRIVEQRADSR